MEQELSVLQNKASEHVYYFDWLRFMACFFVIFMHVAASPIRSLPIGSFEWELCNIFIGLSFTAVPLFFMMSGYLILSNPKTMDYSVFFERRLPKLLVPLLSWPILATIMFSPKSVTLNGLWTMFIDTLYFPQEVHLWYIYTLIALYFFAPILCAGLKALNKQAKDIIFITIIIVEVIFTITTTIPNFPYRLSFDIVDKLAILNGDLLVFLLGYFLGKMKTRIPLASLLIATLASFTIIVWGTHSVSMSSNTYVQTFVNQHKGAEILLAACLFLLFKQYASKKTKLNAVFPVVPLSMGIYFIHIYVIYHFNKYVHVCTGFFDALLVSLIIFSISYIIAKSFASIKFLSYCTLGMEYEEACKTCNFIYTFKYHKAIRINRKKAKTRNLLEDKKEQSETQT